ncbi:MAG TPA: serine/threonine-protein kinase [Polyangiaceae bacterium]|jgi:serine/threonine protein kinase|nr:serine/threonine-protein kinase [Polyangiaceae bacterium]
MRPAPGVWVTSNIELVSPIAEGAMGSVWVAYHHRMQTRVAVKFVSDRLGENTTEALARFEREASTASQIKSAHVVQTFDSGATPEGVPFMVMELLEGESLGDRLRRTRNIAVEEAAAILVQVSRALTKAHMLGIVHRDIKPDNIFLCHGEQGVFCKVLDFGIAKQTQLPAMGELTTEGTMVGTPEYLSPEQVLEGAAVSYRADLWALGVVIYVSLTGSLPYSGKTVGQLCVALASAKHQPPSSLRPSLPATIDAWFRRVLNRKPSDRYGSANEMALAFLRLMPEGAAVNLGVGTVLNVEDTERHFGTASDTYKRVKPPRTRLFIAAALFAALGAAVGLAFVRRPPATATATPAFSDVSIEVDEEHPASSSEVIDLDSAPEPQGKAAPTQVQRKPVARPRIATKKAPPEPAPAAAPPPAGPTPKPESNDSKVRGKAELGF